MRVAIGPGFLGGFTTLSGVMLYTLYVPGPLLAFAYLFGALATSTLAAWVGLSLMSRKKPRARQRGKK
jgi:fluoride ion exporter CrcB/FEX